MGDNFQIFLISYSGQNCLLTNVLCLAYYNENTHFQNFEIVSRSLDLRSNPKTGYFISLFIATWVSDKRPDPPISKLSWLQFWGNFFVCLFIFNYLSNITSWCSLPLPCPSHPLHLHLFIPKIHIFSVSLQRRTDLSGIPIKHGISCYNKTKHILSY